MITDLLAGSNTSLNASALIALANASTSGRNLSDSDEQKLNSIDFATLLSQTMDSGFSVESQNNIIKDSVKSSFESLSQNSVLTAQLKSNVSVDSFNSSPFVNLNERNSFQSSLNVKDNRISSSKSDANPRQEKDVQNVSKEAKNVKEDDSNKNEKVETKEDKNVQENEEGKAVNETEEKVEVKVEGISLEEANLPIEEISLEESELQAAVNTASAIEEEASVVSEDKEADDENETIVVSEANNENAALNFQNVEQSAANEAEKVETEVEVEKVSEVATENTSTELKMADKEVETKEASEEENELSGKAAKNEVPVSEAVNQMQTAQAVETESNEVVTEANSENESIKNIMAANKTASEEETEDVAEADENAEDSEKSSEVTDKANTVKAESKQEKESGLDKLVEKMQKDDNVVPEESLRQKFAEAIGQEKHENSENPDASLAQQAMNVGEQAPQAAATAANPAEETANKIFAALTGKSEGVNGKADPSQILVAGSEGASKGFTMGQNNGSGMNNSFSFQSGVNQTYNENGKLSQAQNTPMTSFSELLTKAEMVKTKDGAKVMNIELEQEGIGKLELELSSKDGEVTARLSAESELAKAKLEELTPQIKENLIEKGVNLTQINVDVSPKNADESGDKYLNSGRKRSKSNRLGRIEGNSVKEIIEKRILPNLRREALNIQSVDITV